MKVILLGQSGVGKTALLRRYADGLFDPGGGGTVGADCRVVTIGDRKVQFWDTAGQERYRTLIKAYYRGSQACLVVFDVTRPETFEHVPYWISAVREYEPDVRVVLVANKCDAPGRAVRESDGRAFAERSGARYFEASARDRIGVRGCFEACVVTVPVPEPMQVQHDYVRLRQEDEPPDSCGCA